MAVRMYWPYRGAGASNVPLSVYSFLSTIIWTINSPIRKIKLGKILIFSAWVTLNYKEIDLYDKLTDLYGKEKTIYKSARYFGL